MSRRIHYIIISERKLVLKGGILVDLSAIGSRIKVARERKHFTQEDLAAIVDLSPTHISVIERGVKPPKLATQRIRCCRMLWSGLRKVFSMNSQLTL